MRTNNQKITDPVLDTYLAFALNLDSLRFAVKAEMHSHDLSPTDDEVDAIIGERLGVDTETIEQLQASTGVECDCGCGEDNTVAIVSDIQPNTLVYKKDTKTGKDPKNTGISMLYMGKLTNDPTYAVVALTISRQCDEIKITRAMVWSEPHTAIITSIKLSDLEPLETEAV